MPKPIPADLQAFFTAAGLTPPSDDAAQSALDASLSNVSSLTGLEFVSLGDGEIQDPEARDFITNGESVFFLEGGARALSSVQPVQYDGTAGTAYLPYQYRAEPLNKPVKRYLWSRFGGWPCGESMVRVTALWGVNLAEYPALFQASVYGAAVSLLGSSLYAASEGGIKSKKEGASELVYSDTSNGALASSWDAILRNALRPYRKVSL